MLIRLTNDLMAPLSLSSLPGTPTADSHQQPTTISLAGEGRAKTSVAFCRKLGTYASGLVCLNWPGHYPLTPRVVLVYRPRRHRNRRGL